MSFPKKTYIRNLQSISRSYLVSLPSAFLEHHGLKEEEKPSVTISINDDWSLTITPHMEAHSVREEARIECYREVAREVVEKLLSGVERIVVYSSRFIPQVIRDELYLYVDGLPQAEIMEETDQKVVIYNLGFKNIPNRKILHRMMNILSEMFTNIMEHKDISRNIEELKKFYVILVGNLRKFQNTGISHSVSDEEEFTHKKASDYRLFAYQLKTLGYLLEDIELESKWEDFFREVADYFEHIFKAFLKKDERAAHKLWFENQQLEGKGKSIGEKLHGEGKLKLKILLIVIKTCRSMTALIY